METRGILSAPGLVAILAVALAVVGYLAVRRRLERRDLALLLAMRGAALLLLWVALLEPTRVFTREIAIPAQVALMLDRSQSMAIVDELGPDGPLSRWDVARAAMESMSARLSDRFQVREYVFDVRARPRQPGEVDLPEGPATDLRGAIATAMRDARGAPLSGVVVFTDGARNVGSALGPAEYPAPVFPVGVGKADAGHDIVVASLDMPETLLAGETAVATATVVVRGYDGRQFTLALTRGAQLVDVAQIHVDGSVHTEDVRFDVAPEEAGSFRYAVEISPLAEELTALNNRATRAVQVLPSRTRVLVVWGAPDHEFAFLRRALRALPSVDLTIAMPAMPDAPRDADSRPARVGRYPVDGLSTDVPSDLGQLADFDVLIVGDVSLAMLSPAQTEWIAQFVESRGGGVAWCAGARWLGRRSGAPGLEPLLPVDMPPLGARRSGASFAPLLTRAGRSHPVTQLAETAADNDLLWRRLPLWSGQYRGLRAKPGATTLVAGGPAEEPLVVHHRVGAGKTLLVATDALWRWALDDALSGDPSAASRYQRFWAQTTRWLATPPDTRQVRIEVPATEFDTGSSTELTVRVFSAGFVPEPEAVVLLSLEGPTGEIASVPVTPSAGGPGAYRATLRLPREGDFTLRAEATARGVLLGSDSTTISVHTSTLEYRRPARDDALLAEIAAASGGKFVTVADADTVVGLLRPSDTTREVRERKALWNTPALLIAVAALLGSEWWLRKRRGLV